MTIVKHSLMGLQDETLEVIEQAVDQAGELAKQINDETKIQGEMLDKLTQDVDKVQDHMDSVNVKMKKSLIEVRESWPHRLV